MKRLLFTLFLCLMALNLQAQDNNTFSHTVERGQTVYAIATMYQVSVADIIKLNPESQKKIRPGQVLLIPQHTNHKPNQYTFHTIQKGETLYGLSIRYKVTGENIMKANPGLSASNFKEGATIRIPAQTQLTPQTKTKLITTYKTYKIKRRETMYSLCRKFKLSSTQLISLNPLLKKGVKKGMEIRIPKEMKEVEVPVPAPIQNEYEVNALLNQLTLTVPTRPSDAKIVLLLPFDTMSKIHTAQQKRFVEYYEGLLLAIDNMRQKGLNITLSVFDISRGSDQIKTILSTPTLKESNLIIGGVSSDQIKPIASFAQEYGIKYVIPFTSKNDEVLSNSYIFQVNTPHSYLYDKAALAFCNLYKDDNVILVDTKDGYDKAKFISTLKDEMDIKKIPYTNISIDVDTFAVELAKLYSLDKRNVVVPLSGTLDALNKIKSTLRMHAEITDEERPEPYHLTLFGYPEWQTYMRECLEDFYALDTHIYSNFYASSISPEVGQFYDLYKHWFSKTLINTYPKYSMLGYDTGMFFLKAIHTYGVHFEKHLQDISYKGLQSNFDFTRVNNWGGYVNTHLFMVHFSTDYTIIRKSVEP